ncbi:MAG: peptidoglycan -binding protein [Alphaproteobacteria bacterium]|nr:peptidoglycan -binding protein [Alphaproteobacteria bacterium]
MRAANTELETKLADERELTNLSQRQIEELSAKAEDQVRLLNQQIAAMRNQVAALQEALQASEAKYRDQNVQITNRGSRLNEELASRVQELARYRSEFFGRLREVIGDRQDLRIVGDRFVFQLEVLFARGETDIGEAGRGEPAKLGGALAEISRRIPKDIDWVLRVDGHTDVRPIATARFPSNWELSTARAVSVVKFLIDHGVPPGRLVAAGFGEYRPIEATGTEDALTRNRRIEFKMDQL